MTEKAQKYVLKLYRGELQIIKRIELSLTDTALEALCEEMDDILSWIDWRLDVELQEIERKRDMAEDERT